MTDKDVELLRPRRRAQSKPNHIRHMVTEEVRNILHNFSNQINSFTSGEPPSIKMDLKPSNMAFPLQASTPITG